MMSIYRAHEPFQSWHLLAAAALTILCLAVNAHWQPYIDYQVYRSAVTSAQAGLPAYSAGFFYPPPALTVLQPFNTNGIAWLLTSILSVAVGLYALGARGKFALTYLLFVPVLTTLYWGQMNALVFASIAIAYAAGSRRQSAAAGIALAVAVSLKLTPALLILYFVFKRDWRAVGWFTVGVLVFILIPLVQFGSVQIGAFIGAFQHASAVDSPYNLALPGMARYLVVALLIGLAAARPAQSFTALLLAMLFISPIFWLHHWLMALPAFVLARRGRWALLVVGLELIGFTGIPSLIAMLLLIVR